MSNFFDWTKRMDNSFRAFIRATSEICSLLHGISFRKIMHLQGPFQSSLNSPAHILVSRFSLTPSNKRLMTRGESEMKEENIQGDMLP